MNRRRALLLSGLLAARAEPSAWAQQRRSLADPLRLGVDLALIESGLAKALQQGFGSDTGIAVQLAPGPALPVLEALERAEFDAALCNAPEAEAGLEQQGLVHDRRAIARGEFVLVGPRLLGLAGGRDAAATLVRIRDTAAAGAASFLSANDGSGTHVAEQALWRAAQIAPVAPWYVAADSGRGLIAQSRERHAYALVERGAWGLLGGAPLAVVGEGDPRLGEAVHVMRSFRVNHPAAKIFVAWIAGPKGRTIVAAQRSYRP